MLTREALVFITYTCVGLFTMGYNDLNQIKFTLKIFINYYLWIGGEEDSKKVLNTL